MASAADGPFLGGKQQQQQQQQSNARGEPVREEAKTLEQMEWDAWDMPRYPNTWVWYNYFNLFVLAWGLYQLFTESDGPDYGDARDPDQTLSDDELPPPTALKKVQFENALEHSVHLLFATGNTKDHMQMYTLTEILSYTNQSTWLFDFVPLLVRYGVLEGFQHTLSTGSDAVRAKTLAILEIMTRREQNRLRIVSDTTLMDLIVDCITVPRSNEYAHMAIIGLDILSNLSQSEDPLIVSSLRKRAEAGLSGLMMGFLRFVEQQKDGKTNLSKDSDTGEVVELGDPLWGRRMQRVISRVFDNMYNTALRAQPDELHLELFTSTMPNLPLPGPQAAVEALANLQHLSTVDDPEIAMNAQDILGRVVQAASAHRTDRVVSVTLDPAVWTKLDEIAAQQPSPPAVSYRWLNNGLAAGTAGGFGLAWGFIRSQYRYTVLMRDPEATLPPGVRLNWWRVPRFAATAAIGSMVHHTLIKGLLEEYLPGNPLQGDTSSSTATAGVSRFFLRGAVPFVVLRLAPFSMAPAVSAFALETAMQSAEDSPRNHIYDLMRTQRLKN